MSFFSLSGPFYLQIFFLNRSGWVRVQNKGKWAFKMSISHILNLVKCFPAFCVQNEAEIQYFLLVSQTPGYTLCPLKRDGLPLSADWPPS